MQMPTTTSPQQPPSPSRADGLVIACPEYAHGIPGAFKNALDWLVGMSDFPGKPVMLVNTAPRAFHAQAQLREVLATMAARLVPDSFVTFDLGEPDVHDRLLAGLAAFVHACSLSWPRSRVS